VIVRAGAVLTRTAGRFDASGDARADLRVDARPVLDHPLLNLRGHRIRGVADDVRHEVLAIGVGEDFAHHRAGLAEVVVLAVQRVRVANHIRALHAPYGLGE
jgi:hypothetical protein